MKAVFMLLERPTRKRHNLDGKEDTNERFGTATSEEKYRQDSRSYGKNYPGSEGCVVVESPRHDLAPKRFDLYKDRDEHCGVAGGFAPEVDGGSGVSAVVHATAGDEGADGFGEWCAGSVAFGKCA